ncbi:MAG: hypothetical protein QXM89_00890 [Candidatus Bathyarchaeia archaeon]
MLIELGSQIVKRIKDIYDKDSRGWSVLAGLDSGGRLDFYISHRNELLWKLKSKPINPYSYITVGAEIRDLNSEIFMKVFNEGQPFGFQALFPQDDLKTILMFGLGKYAVKRRTPLFESEKPIDEELTKKVEEFFSKTYPERKMAYV